MPTTLYDDTTADSAGTRAHRLPAWLRRFPPWFPPAALLTAATAAALAVGPLPGRVEAAPAAAAALAALTLSGSAGARLLTALAMVPVALLPQAPALSFAAAAVALSLATGLRASVPGRAHGQLERHLTWARRREEEVALLTARTRPPTRDAAERLARALRVTDSVEVVRTSRGYELRAIVDARDLDRALLERRLLAQYGPDVEFGWALFPDQGLTLDALVAAATRAPARPAATSARPAAPIGEELGL